MRIGYVPYSPDLSPPADRRRFPYYARRRGLPFELATAESSYDVVLVTPRADLDRWSAYRPGRAKVVFDIVDSYLDIPRWDPKALLRGPAKFLAREARHPFYSYRRALERMLARADATTCATPEQAMAIARFCPNVHPIVDFQSDLIGRVKDDYTAASPFRLVWEGVGSNVKWFSEIRGALRDVDGRHPLVLHVIAPLEYREFVDRFWRRRTSDIATRHFHNVKLHQWSEEMVSVIATACDAAVIPLPLDRPLEGGKSENKLISFWAMGLPTITSATPAYARAMDEAGQDLTCVGQDEWVDRLVRLVEDERARRDAGLTGRAFAEEKYGDERLLEAWDHVFASLNE